MQVNQEGKQIIGIGIVHKQIKPSSLNPLSLFSFLPFQDFRISLVNPWMHRRRRKKKANNFGEIFNVPLLEKTWIVGFFNVKNWLKLPFNSWIETVYQWQYLSGKFASWLTKLASQIGNEKKKNLTKPCSYAPLSQVPSPEQVNKTARDQDPFLSHKWLIKTAREKKNPIFFFINLPLDALKPI